MKKTINESVCACQVPCPRGWPPLWQVDFIDMTNANCDECDTTLTVIIPSDNCSQ